MLFVQWCKDHRKVKRTTEITMCPLCVLEENERLIKRIEEIETELEWIASLWDDDKRLGELASDLYDASRTARKLLNQTEKV